MDRTSQYPIIPIVAGQEDGQEKGEDALEES